MRALLACFLVLAAAAKAEPPWYSPTWARMQARMGPIDFDGKLTLSYPLGRIEADGVGWDASLEHTVDIDSADQPSSRWVVPGFLAWLAPESRNGLGVLLPNGRHLHFRRVQEGQKPVRDRYGPWHLSRQREGFSVESPLGNRYLYSGGQLVRIRTRLGMELAVDAKAGRIHSIAAPQGIVFRCDYDRIGEPVAARFADGQEERFSWKDGLLRTWTDGSGIVTRFDYRDRLVTGVQRAGGSALEIGWSPVPDWIRWSDVWWSPARVTRYGPLSLAYALDHDGAWFTATDRDTGRRTVTNFNWRTGVVTQRVGHGPTTIATYITARIRPGYFTSIRRGDGTVLESYGYGADGRLDRVRRLRPDGKVEEISSTAEILAGWDGETQPGVPIYEP